MALEGGRAISAIRVTETMDLLPWGVHPDDARTGLTCVARMSIRRASDAREQNLRDEACNDDVACLNLSAGFPSVP